MTEERAEGTPTHRIMWKDKEHRALCCCQKSPPLNWPVKVCLRRARNSTKKMQEGTWLCLIPSTKGKRYRKNCIESALDTGTTTEAPGHSNTPRKDHAQRKPRQQCTFWHTARGVCFTQLRRVGNQFKRKRWANNSRN